MIREGAISSSSPRALRQRRSGCAARLPKLDEASRVAPAEKLTVVLAAYKA